MTLITADLHPGRQKRHETVPGASGYPERQPILPSSGPYVRPALGQLKSPSADGGTTIQRRPNRTGLPDALKFSIESLSGLSMDHARVHRNSPYPAAIHAHAFTQNNDIHLGPGQDHMLAHEAWHLVQQAQGRVRPTVALDGIAVNADERLEREADVMGNRADIMGRGNCGVPQTPIQSHAPTPPATTSASPVLQGGFLDWIKRKFGRAPAPARPPDLDFNQMQFASRPAPMPHGVNDPSPERSIYFPNGRIRLHHDAGPALELLPPGHNVDRQTVPANLRGHHEGSGAFFRRMTATHQFAPAVVDQPGRELFEVYRDPANNITAYHHSRGGPVTEQNVQDQNHLNRLTDLARMAERDIGEARTDRGRLQLIQHYNQQMDLAYGNPNHKWKRASWWRRRS